MTTPHAFPVPGSTRFRGHEHDATHICVVLDGGFVEREKHGWRDVAPGTVRVSGAARHDIDFSPAGATCLVLEVDDPPFSPLAAAKFIENDNRLGSLAREISNHSWKRDPAGRVRTNNLTTEFLAQIVRRLSGKTTTPPPWLERIRDLIHDTTGSTSVEDLAREAGVHRVHLARTFRDHYGVPVTRYARQVRVQSALTLLATGSISLSQLAHEAGFADQSHLTREVRAAVGSTPGAIRSRLHPFKT
ncbi:MAG: AraC family transcriptional regulator [Gemmatimonadales bacterium]